MITAMLLTMNNLVSSQAHKKISINEFEKIIEKHDIENTIISQRYNVINVKGNYKDENGRMVGFDVRYPLSDQIVNELTMTLKEKDTTLLVEDPFEPNALRDYILPLIPYALVLGAMIFIMRNAGGGNARAFDFGKSKAKIQGDVKVRFDDVAGADEEKEEMKELIDYLKTPKRFEKMGARIPKGMLLVGPPGTGKTLLARAAAGEADVPFYSISGSDFVEMFVGVGASRVRDMFKKAKQTAPCIIFIDEIDSIGGKRNALSNSEHNQTINALLTEMDGFAKDSGILVLATTNQPNNLDPALKRSGRFDSHISIPLPFTTEDRLKIINVHKRGREFDEDIDFKSLAKQWVGFSGADIESILNEAAIIATKDNLPVISKECLDEAFYKKVLKGHVKKNGQSERKREELELVAYHEAGHAVARKLLNVGEVSKVTILSTTSGAGGVTFNIPEKMGLFSMGELESEVKILYAGRAAEYLLHRKDIRKVTTGAQNDIERATEIIKGIVMKFGLQREPMLLNLTDFPEGRDYTFKEMKELSVKLFNEIVTLLEKHYDLLQLVAERLLEKETIEAEELNEIIESYLAEENIA